MENSSKNSNLYVCKIDYRVYNNGRKKKAKKKITRKRRKAWKNLCRQKWSIK